MRILIILSSEYDLNSEQKILNRYLFNEYHPSCAMDEAKVLWKNNSYKQEN